MILTGTQSKQIQEALSGHALLPEWRRMVSTQLDIELPKQSAARRIPTWLLSTMLLLVDQFEELSTLCKDVDEFTQFADNLLVAAQANGAVTLILTLWVITAS